MLKGGTEVFKIVPLPSFFHFVGSEEKMSRAKKKFVPSCIVIIYLAPGIFKPLFEFQTLQMQNYPAGTSKLIPFVPTRIYLEIIPNVEIFSLTQNNLAGTSELFPLGANSDVRRKFTLRRSFPAGV